MKYSIKLHRKKLDFEQNYFNDPINRLPPPLVSFMAVTWLRLRKTQASWALLFCLYLCHLAVKNDFFCVGVIYYYINHHYTSKGFVIIRKSVELMNNLSTLQYQQIHYFLKKFKWLSDKSVISQMDINTTLQMNSQRQAQKHGTKHIFIKVWKSHYRQLKYVQSV